MSYALTSHFGSGIALTIDRRKKTMSDFSLLREKLFEKGVSRAEVVGCSDSELREIDESFIYPLPADYRSMMKVLGKKAGPVFSDSVFFYPHVLYLNVEVRAWICDALVLPQSYYCFFNNLGTHLAFLDTEEESESRIYTWDDGNPNKLRRSKLNLYSVILREIDLI